MNPNEKHIPPQWATRFLHGYCPASVLEEIEGDLIENYERNVILHNKRYADLRYIIDTIRFFNPVTFRKARKIKHRYHHSSSMHTAMIKNYFISALRNVRKNLAYTAINISGLALGIACCLIIFVIVRYESSFDDYHSKADRIYRVNLNQEAPNTRRFNGCNYTPLAEAVRSVVTGLEAVTGVYCLQQYQINRNEEIIEGTYAFFADSHYFDVFDGSWIRGDNRALSKPNTAVVTDRFAEDFLGGVSNAVGETFLLDNKVPLTVGGVIKSPPSNTDHPYSMLISWSTLAQFTPGSDDDWENVSAGATYVVFRPETRSDQLYPQFERIIASHLEPELAEKTSFYLMPLNDNHDRNYDYSSFTYDFPKPVMIILSIVGGMIAFIACINFINLATAQSLTRAREVGIRKTMGSSRMQLVGQYLSEAFVITLIAGLAGLALAKAGIVQLNSYYGDDNLQLDFINEPSTLIFFSIIILVITVLAGFYPAIVLSGYRPVSALKAQKSSGKQGLTLRRGLVLAQFTGAQILIIVTFLMINQINFFRNRDLGFDPSAIMILPYLKSYDQERFVVLDQELRKVKGRIDHTFAYGGPVGVGSNQIEIHPVDDETNSRRALLNYGDAAYLNTFSISLLAGTNFTDAMDSASSEVLVNETLIKLLGYDRPAAAVGGIFTADGRDVRIRGVMRDNYTHAMTSTVEPFILAHDPEQIFGVAIRFSKEKISETIAGVEAAWKIAYPGYICNYMFMDDLLNREFNTFDRIFTFLGIASITAIFIGSLGLFGLVSFMAVRRTKEIGIRKVLGATITNIITLFTKESMVLIIVAFVVAAPLAYFTGNLMLLELPERVTPDVMIFLYPLVISMGIAGMTVGFRAFQAARQHPTDSLRTE